MADQTGTTLSETVRHGLLFRTMMEVLRDSHEPRQAGDVVAEVRRRVPFTDHEASVNASGKVRGSTAIRFDSSWAKIAGWLTKVSEGWRLTPVGLGALDRLPDPDHLYVAMLDEYNAAMGARQAAQARAETDAKYARLESALDLVDAASWTTYGDLAEVADLAVQGVETFLSKSDSPNAFRVLSANGTVAEGLLRSDPAKPDDPVKLLREEGVDFDEEGRASQAQRLTAYELIQLLDGEEAEPGSAGVGS